jgi:hypothetical protein
MQVLPTAPSPTVTHLMNRDALIGVDLHFALLCALHLHRVPPIFASSPDRRGHPLAPCLPPLFSGGDLEESRSRPLSSRGGGLTREEARKGSPAQPRRDVYSSAIGCRGLLRLPDHDGFGKWLVRGCSFWVLRSSLIFYFV